MFNINITDCLCGGVAALGGTVFSNPFEVVRTRIQLQGELAAKGTYVKPYKSVLHAFIQVGKSEGLTGLQKGLVPSLYSQFILNAIRLGIYNGAMDSGLLNDRPGHVSFIRALFYGSLGSSLGYFVASPLLMARAVKDIAVGTQHKHTRMSEALKSIYASGGISGLYRGYSTTILRGCFGGGSQIATFGKTKNWLREQDYVVQPILNSFVASLLAGWVNALAVTPADVLATRLYNQSLDKKTGKGVLYQNLADCFVKILRTEGIYGLYKGFWPNYLRLAPHTTVILVIFDELLKVKNLWTTK